MRGGGVVWLGSIDDHEHFFNVGRVLDKNWVCVGCGIDGDDDWVCVGCVCFRLMMGDDFFELDVCWTQLGKIIILGVGWARQVPSKNTSNYLRAVQQPTHIEPTKDSS